ncbi:MAG: UDP-3-O-(3-hydroxymyristoyl)glucosamine N-acyltransferase [Bacteroidota bacterium]|nr:UDP-3-O-(3-hydroxymyristoyl)glucosamine N-acyltransferase [Bacteroidota bacterium]MDP4215547.1 UDP-3-O-(3-hydroxymyristoyl)glucosamine N-acyltransferase [Bacteroidota bacterium]MDP4245177.1 UDP-3-O-(3-hydroxymyristoyl)glucosamine N-acyltransferase [Bacteroidota bacterium]MDP4256442.1 UDP-3-O-(3-hydroxymyristoyl)glucosamine N-acyltransferase [Bacteroidota bacterium]MDP4258237.1 UDP-3-O-(3-hydroxymyristoyl)glucosamine N-acyltransferase [Bacteroidota bacterium]
MRFPSPVSLEWMANFLGAQLIGDKQGMATGINEIHKVEEGDLVFVDHPKYYDACIRSRASFIIINKVVDVPPGKALLVVEQPFEAYLRIVRHFRPFEPAVKPISDSAVIGKRTTVYPGAFIGHHVVIGEDCIIHPNVTILDHCLIGDRVIIQAGTVIGSDAFYYNTKKDREVWYRKMESCGRVVIEDDVEIGAGCTIDRGVSHDTRIGKGSKMDNLIHIGHDTVVGRNCLFAGQVGIAGAVEIGNGVTLWGQVGVSKTLTIEDNVTVFAQSGVGGTLERGKIYFGSPAEEASVKKRELVWIKRIPELWKKVVG